MDERERRGLEIAARLPLRANGTRWLVPSQSSGGMYTVDMGGELPTCTCADYDLRAGKCKHIHAVLFTVQREAGPLQIPLAPQQQARPTYAQNWPAYHAAQRNEKREFMRLLHDLCQTIEQPAYKFGRPMLLLSDMVFGTALKVYSTLSGRRAMGDLDTAVEKGYLASAPHFNSLFNYMESDILTPVLEELVGVAAAPLSVVESAFAADSSGFSTSRFDRWYDEKYGRPRSQKIWVKAHIMVGVKTNVVTAVTVTGRDANDSPHLPGLLDATAQRFTVAQVSADKAYLGERNLDAIARAGAAPYIPFKVNSTPNGSDLWNKLYATFMYNRAAFLPLYHKRSNVETAFSMIKAKFGDALRSKSDRGQINEMLLKVLCHNICCLIQEMYELGINPLFGEAEAGAPAKILQLTHR